VLTVCDDFVAERSLASSAAATKRKNAGNKKPDINIGRSWPGRPVIRFAQILRWVFTHAFKKFSIGFRQRSSLNTGCRELGRLF
jgi:hypothetical protein